MLCATRCQQQFMVSQSALLCSKASAAGSRDFILIFTLSILLSCSVVLHFSVFQHAALQCSSMPAALQNAGSKDLRWGVCEPRDHHPGALPGCGWQSGEWHSCCIWVALLPWRQVSLQCSLHSLLSICTRHNRKWLAHCHFKSCVYSRTDQRRLCLLSLVTF